MTSHRDPESSHHVILNYSEKRPFSSFLPGVAGHLGVPMWVFYVNRGQAITSFGIESKDCPLMEFQPANKAYQRTATEGFRTFVKWATGKKTGFYEPFAPFIPTPSELGTDERGRARNIDKASSISSKNQNNIRVHPRSSASNIQRTMSIAMSELSLTDDNPALGLTTKVDYFTIPGEGFAALARQVTFTNTGDIPQELEILDGMPALIPFGVDNGGLKAVGRTLEAWMQVFHLESGLPFFRLGATPGDTAEVHEIQAGHFSLGFTVCNGETSPLLPFVDPAIIFGANTSLSAPDLFLKQSFKTLQAAEQVTVGKTPCAFFGHTATLAPGESLSLYMLFGHVNGHENIAQSRDRLIFPAYFAQKRAENQALVNSLTDAVATRTGEPRFDAYVHQTFLDNVLRGGWPILLGDAQNPHPYHIYSRKHGDPERDYNHFFLAPEFYSQGNGNFRDVCQNRRSDVLLEPRIGEHNIRTFLSLIQLDGYNPLVIQGTSFSLAPEQVAAVARLSDAPSKLALVLEEKFTPGGLLKYIVDQDISLSVSYDEFIVHALREAQPHLEAAYGEGFWVDHWTYILDLVENFLAVYPDRKVDLLFGDVKVSFYRSPVQVRPRSQRYIFTERGARQYGAVAHTGESGWVRTSDGEIYSTTIFGKLLLLVGTKFGTLGPEGMGIEMEAGKPGWYDALNGLPGIFSSSMNETYELLRLICFLRESLTELEVDPLITLPAEFSEYLKNLAALTNKEATPFSWWKQANDLREAYRECIYQAKISGKETELESSVLDNILNTIESRLREGIARAETYAQHGLSPTYFRYKVSDYEILEDELGNPLLGEQERPFIQAKAFQPIPLPPFLEGVVHSMRVASGDEKVRKIYTAVRGSGLYDQVLKMYKVNASLENEPHEIGRARAFTPGWLENESIWLHMEYKYLLEVLKAGLYEEFFEDFKCALIPFQPPERYGRSPLENSSFLVSSAHPDKSLHGAGFVARLSGATAEFIEIWTIMMAGVEPFRVQEGELILGLRPILPGWLFDEQNQVKFNFLGSIPVTYHNPQRIDAWKQMPQNIVLHLADGQSMDIQSSDIHAPYADMVRNKKVVSLDVFFD